MLSEGRGDPEGSYVLLEAIPRMVGALGAQSRLLNAPLEQRFADGYGTFRAAAKRLGGVEEESRAGTHVWKFDVLPKIPVKLIFDEADDDFPLSVQIMLDRTAVRFLEFECLAFMVGCLVRALVEDPQHGDLAVRSSSAGARFLSAQRCCRFMPKVIQVVLRSCPVPFVAMADTFKWLAHLPGESIDSTGAGQPQSENPR